MSASLILLSQQHQNTGASWIFSRTNQPSIFQTQERVSRSPPLPPRCSNYCFKVVLGFPAGSDAKESACNAGDLCSVPVSGRCPGGGHDNPLQYSYLENPMDRGVRWATVHGVAKSCAWLSDQHYYSADRCAVNIVPSHFHFCNCLLKYITF